MKPHIRQAFFTIAFLPHNRTTDRRAEWYMRQIHANTQDEPKPRPLWPLALSALLLWSTITAAVWFLIHTWSA